MSLNQKVINSIIDETMNEHIEDLFSKKKRIDTKPVTFWLPLEYQKKFETVQQMTDRKFGKMIQKIIVKTLDRVEIDKTES